MAGVRTSVYLTEELAAAVKASGVPLAELVRRGLGRDPAVIVGGVPIQVTVDDRMPRGYMAMPDASAVPVVVRLGMADPVNCPHRGLNPGAWCKTCQSVVPERKNR